jgi:hypothetical protein
VTDDADTANHGAIPPAAHIPRSLESAQEPTPTDPAERQLLLSRNRDDQVNLQSRPPDGEVVTFRSLTIADVFVGCEVDDAAEAISALDWAEEGPPIAEEVRTALRGYLYYRVSFWIREPGRQQVFSGMPQAWASLPAGVDRVFCSLSVLGPSLIAIVATFVFDEPAARLINEELHRDGRSQVIRGVGDQFSIRGARGDKKERVSKARNELSGHCLEWLSTAFGGTLSRVSEGARRPTCHLVTLARGRPFSTQEPYMAILGLVNRQLAQTFVGHDFLYWTSPLGLSQTDNSTVVFNENDALSPGGLGDLSSSPEEVHEIINSGMIAAAIYAALASFTPQLRNVRSAMIRLDLRKATSDELSKLRTTLFEVSGKLAAFVGDTKVLARENYAIWADLTALRPLEVQGATNQDYTAEEEKRALVSTADSLLTEEEGIRTLLLALTEAKSDVTNTALQESIRRLTTRLAALTGVLVALTVALVVIALVTSH